MDSCHRRHGRGVLKPMDVTALERGEGWVTVSGEVTPGSLIAQANGTMRRGQVVRFGSGAGRGGAER